MKWIMGVLVSLIVIGCGGFFFLQSDQSKEAVTEQIEGVEESREDKNLVDEQAMVQESDHAEIEWIGEWARNLLNYTGQLEITNVTQSSFYFTLGVNAGANVGMIEGETDRDGEQAVWTDLESGCELSFQLSENQIEIEQNDACQYWGGAGTFFDGEYEKGEVAIETDLVEQGVLGETEDALIRTVVGKHYDLYLQNISSYSDQQDQDGLETRVVSGFIRGIAPSNGGIIMVNQKYVYAAVTDSENSVILYHTNDPKDHQKLPKTIEDWKDGMLFDEVVFE